MLGISIFFLIFAGMKKDGLIASLLDFVFPRFCPACGARLRIDEEAVCLHCNILLPRTNHWQTPSENSMEQLFRGRVKVEKAAAFFRYKSKTDNAGIVYDFKYHHRPQLALKMGVMMAEEMKGHGFFDGIDCIVPVPLSLKRRMKRGYNQSEMLARGAGKVTGLPVLPWVVIRNRFDGSQTHLSKWERDSNVKGVFELRDADSIAGKHVLVVDDVITTGATVASCAGELLRARDCRVSVLSLGFAGKRE